MKKIFTLLFSLFLILSAISVIFIIKLSQDLPNPKQIKDFQITESTKIYDRSGKILLYEIHKDERRTFIPLSQMPKHFIFATLAAEDIDFYNHPAISIKSIFRAFINNLKTKDFSQGGSTITQQLAKNIFLTPEKTIKRKIKEIILAFELEIIYSKNEILELYLNQIPYGSNAYGAEAASWLYFNKSIKDVNLAEAALLASLTKAPTYYSPWGPNKKDLFERQKYILNRLLEYDFINKEEYDLALKQTQEIKIFPPNLGLIKAPHFVFMVKDYLVKKYGEEMVEKGGLKVITTLDWELQEIAEKVVLEGAERNKELYQGYNASLVAQDPKTGQILALVGSKDYFAKNPEPENCLSGVNCAFEPEFNVAYQGLRQPGSALKPFVYLTAFQKGLNPETLVIDAFTEFNLNCPAIINSYSLENPLCFHPQNFDNKFRGPVNLKTALAQSINVPAVKVLYIAGLENVIKNLNLFGIKTLDIKQKNRYGLSLVLGGGEVRLLDLVNAYSVLANDGFKNEINLILKIEKNKGEILEEYEGKKQKIIDSDYVRLINQILKDPELRRGLFQNSLDLTIFPGYEVALKTGTTNDYRDAWAIGYTPFLTVGIWAGNNNNQPMQKYAGSVLAAVPIWSNFLKQVINKFSIEYFKNPENDFSKIVNEINKPMLNGKLGNPVHNILHYINKEDILGPSLKNPYLDPQYYHWEVGVNQWLRKNTAYYNIPPPTLPYNSQIQKKPIELNIIFKNPLPNSNVSLPLKLEAQIKSEVGLSSVELYVNNRMLEKRNYLGGNSNYYSYIIEKLNKDENTITLKAIDLDNNMQIKSIKIIY